MPRPAKRTKLLDDASISSSDSEDDGVTITVDKPTTNGGFTINSDYARRFEHNKKREERHRLEEKFASSSKRPRDDDDDEEEDSSSDETEDDDAELATADLDAEILDTLQAIKRKDPRVYDKNVKFYREFDEDGVEVKKEKEEKPMYLQDYHRRNLMEGHVGGEEDDEVVQPTYQQEQDALKRELVGSMHAQAGANHSTDAAESDDDGDDFLVAKTKPTHSALPTTSKPPSKKKDIPEVDPSTADADPETYLSNFMAARAWLPTDSKSAFPTLDSDSSDEEARADAFEEAYNLRFEDPALANAKLQSFSRSVGKDYGVRRDEKSSRKRAREKEREKKEAEKKEREEERARLRRLRVEEAEEKVKRIREAAGLKAGEAVDVESWREVIEGEWDDERWEQEMRRRFGDQYYEAGEDDDAGVETAEEKRKRKLKKPKWEDDIDIKDLVPDFEDESAKPNITLDDEEDDEEDGGALIPPEDTSADEDEQQDEPSQKRKTTKKDRLAAKTSAKRTARLERRALEEIVDATLPIATAPVTGFRYRETSPTSFGLTARDILFADDKALNQFVGLKKMAAWREEEKKRKDRKRLSKKQRLREWRKETFGDENGPKVPEVVGVAETAGPDGGIAAGERKKKKRSRKGKGKKEVEA